MSLEDKVGALVDAINANTDALQHLAAAYRLDAARAAPSVDKATLTPVPPPKPEPNEPNKPAADAKPRGRPPKAPAEAAAEKQAAAAATKATSTTANAPAAGNGSAPAATYEDLSAVVPLVAEKYGRSRAISLFAELGVANGLELKSKHPEKIAAAVALFRGALK